MQFNITIDKEPFSLEIKDELMQELSAVHQDMDMEFDKGLQLGRYWKDEPTVEERCQLVADRVVGAIHQQNIRLVYINAGYILSKMPALKMVTVDSDYEINDIDFQ